jgi:hypothetical protein
MTHYLGLTQPNGATAEAAQPIATVGAQAPDVALTVALSANVMTKEPDFDAAFPAQKSKQHK